MITIRHEQPNDTLAITTLLKLAFLNHPFSINNEYLLVERLREARSLTLSLVATINNEIVGYVASSPITINEEKCNWQGIAPLAVLPKNQERGIGTALMQDAINKLQALNMDGCVLVGDPEYYSKFGFCSASPLLYNGIDAKFFMKLAFKKNVITPGEVKFHPIFYSL